MLCGSLDAVALDHFVQRRGLNPKQARGFLLDPIRLFKRVEYEQFPVLIHFFFERQVLFGNHEGPRLSGNGFRQQLDRN